MNPVRNIKGLGSKKGIPVFVWIPPIYNPVYKIEVEVSSGTKYDITNILIQGEYTDGITETIGNFSFKINNSTQVYTSLFNPYDKVNIYIDYGTTATSLRFVGMIERISKSNNSLILSGRGGASKVLGKNITYSATDKARSTILSEIISENFTSITANNLSTDTETLTVDYFEKPFWDVVKEICTIASYDAYVDADFDFNYFESGSKTNTTEAVVHSKNILEVGDFAPDASSIVNKVRVYGVNTNELPLIYTAEDSTSQTTYESKELRINDSTIKTVAQAKARADYELAKNKDPPTVGTIISLGLPTIEPGEQIRISDPANGLEPKYYTIQKFVHKFSNDDPFKTELTIQKERTTIPSILKDRVKFESELMKNINPNDLDFSYIWDFSSDTGTHSNTEIVINSGTGKGVLKTTTGNDTGTWVSENLSLDSAISSFVQISAYGDSIENIQIFISTNGGTTFYPMIVGNESVIKSGSDIKIKLVLNSSSSQVKTLAFLYNLN